mmetsp:Transcript_13938/g.23933  ORF Transcript_13938/g.23933 Transcript_13938/m.23933 type:complete len:90 (+) Transcript_13938:491-760(+)
MRQLMRLFNQDITGKIKQIVGELSGSEKEGAQLILDNIIAQQKVLIEAATSEDAAQVATCVELIAADLRRFIAVIPAAAGGGVFDEDFS